MAKFTDEIQSTVTIENNQALNKLGQLEMAHSDVRKELKGLYKDMRAYDKAVAKAAKYELGAKKFEEASKKASALNVDIKKYAALLKTAQTNAKGLQKGTAQYEAAKKEVTQLTSKLSELKQSLKNVNAEASKNRLNAKRFGEATTEVKRLEASVDKFNQTAKKVKEASTAVEVYRRSLKPVEMTMNQMRKEAQALQKELDNTVQGTAKFSKIESRLKDVNRAIDAQRASLNHTSKGWKGFSASFKSFGAMAAGVIGGEIVLQAFQWITSFVISVATGAAKISDELSDIQKTTGATRDEVKAMNSEFSKFDTRSSTSSLREIAKIAGTLGIAKEEVVDFTREVDKANVALGDDFGGGAQEITKTFGVIKNLYEDTKFLKSADAIKKAGSAVNALGAAGQAQAPEMTDFTKRIGVLGKLAPTLTETLGLASALTGELGLTAEQGAGGVSAILLEAGKRTKEFSKQLNITEKEFKELLNTDPNAMFLKLAQSMQGLSNTQVVAVLKNIGITSQESIKTMQALATNTDVVVEKQRLAAIEFEKGTSLQDEFNIKNTNFAASLEKASKAWNGLVAGMGSSLQPVMQKALDLFTSLFSKTGQAPSYMKPLIDAFNRVKKSFSIIWKAVMDALKAFGLLEGKSKALDVVFQVLAFTVDVMAFQINQMAFAIQKGREQLVKFYNKSETFRHVVSGAIAYVKSSFTSFFASVSKGWSAISDVMNAIIEGDISKFESALKKSSEVISEVLYTNGKDAGVAFKKGFDEGGGKIKIKTQVEIDGEKAKQEAEKLQEELNKVTDKEARLRSSIDSLKAVKTSEKEEVLALLDVYAQSTEEQRKDIDKKVNELIAKNNQRQFNTNNRQAAPKTNTEADDVEERWKELNAKIQQYKKEQFESTLSDQEKEIAAVADKYNDMLAELDKFNLSKAQREAKENELTKMFKKERLAIEQKYAAQEAKAKEEARNQINEALLDEFDSEILAVENKYNELIRLAKENGLEIEQIEQNKADAIDAIYKRQTESQTAKTLEENEKQRQANFQFMNSLTELFTATNNLMGEQSAGYLEFQKMITIAQIAIDTASAISSITAKQATTSITPIDYAIKVASGIAVVLANIAKAKQVLSTANTPEPPKFSKGAAIDLKDGNLNIRGKSHAAGGIGMFNDAGQKVGEMEGGESYLLLSKRTTENNMPLLSALLQSSQTNGAAVVPNFAAMQQAVRTSNTTINNTTNNNGLSDKLMMEMLYELRMTREGFEKMPKELKSYLVYSDFKEMEDKMNAIQNYSGQ